MRWLSGAFADVREHWRCVDRRVTKPHRNRCLVRNSILFDGEHIFSGACNIVLMGPGRGADVLQDRNELPGLLRKDINPFQELGASWQLHQDFVELFPRSEVLQQYLCEYLIVLMRLCQKVVVFGNRSYPGQLLSIFGSTFDAEFGPLQKEMDQWGALIQQKMQQLAAAASLGGFDMRV